MPIKVQDIINKMEELAPQSLAEDWDNVGLIVGDPEQSVSSIIVALDATQSVIDQAINYNVDMIVTHHPILFSKVNKITTTSMDGQKVIRLIQNRIALFAAHTNLDKAPGGVEDTLAKQLELAFDTILNVRNQVDGQSFGYGRAGSLSAPMSFKKFARKVRDMLGCEYVHTIGDGDKIIKKVALSCGSGADQINRAINWGADVLVTGDIKYHAATEALDRGLCLIDATHYGTEKMVVGLLSNYLRKSFEGIQIIEDRESKNPIQIENEVK